MKLLFAALLSASVLGDVYNGKQGVWRNVNRPGGIDWYGGQFSEENGGFGPQAPQQGFTGWKCYGGNCDNKQMRYAPSSPRILNPGGNTNILTARDISEEGGRSNMECGNRLLTQMRCKGDRCDNTDVYCRDLAPGYRVVKNNHYTNWFSEENGGTMDCPANMWLWGFQCSGGYCDNQRLRCTYVQQFHEAVNCAVSAWGPWTACSKPCAGGTQTQSRTVTRNAANGGAGCPALSQSRACNQQACPVNCVVSGWGAFGECSKTCGGGQQTQTRTVTTAPAHGGAACGALSQSRACNQQACPVNCVVGEFGEWGECSEACDGGEQTRVRTVTTQPAHGGNACPTLSEKQACNEQSCTPSPTQACLGIKNQYVNTLTKVKKAASKEVELVDDNKDPKCECYDLCLAEEADIYMYYVKGNGKAKCKCMTNTQDKFKVNMKTRTDYVSGSISDSAKKAMDKKQNKKSRRGRRRG